MAPGTAGTGGSQGTKRKADGDGGKPGGNKRPAGKTPANTAVFFYLDTPAKQVPCKKDIERIQHACDTPQGKQDGADSLKDAKLNRQQNQPGSAMLGLEGTFKSAITAIDGVGRSRGSYKANASNQWMSDHCTGLWIKPGGKRKDGTTNTEDFKQQIQSQVDALIGEQDGLLNKSLAEMKTFADDYVKRHGQATLDNAAEKAAQRTAASRFPVLASVLGRMSLYQGLGKVLGQVAAAAITGDLAQRFARLEKALAVIQGRLDELKKILSPGGLEDAMASAQAAIAFANPCLRARKCMLIPYKDSDKSAKGNGCCPGQTGHHLLPDAMFHEYVSQTHPKTGKEEMKQGGNRACWEKYKHGDAPTICLEGTTNRASNGSHGMAHKGTEVALNEYLGKSDMPYTQARDKLSQLIATAFHCDADCLKAQLNEYYGKVHKCGPLDTAEVTPHSGNPGQGPDVSDTSDTPM
ncbi:HNH/endonuclease VII fold toxin-2 domain-containing protein [Pseudomonas sp. RIT-PI-AD]|uniref:HNH/endonuclease VII fold toxin-2 domain-containing protein n=1 Tax=Pseudomonas sp. RIT-PI-AD TaxID=3035294 RepID=UPI0021D968AE|nr:HNH/endonuclease VII fold toxin-2 domain-containing protein [Pseudomonas sp. RIT-PI-AD]